MDTEFTPNKLLDNLNKNYPQIVGEALIGYYKFWKIEQDLLQMIRQNPEILGAQRQNNTELSNLLAIANCIQYGKSYFYSEVNKNLIEMTQIIIPYVDLIQTFPTQQTKSTATIEVLSEGIGGQKGGIPFWKRILGLIASLTLNSCYDSTALAGTITPPGKGVVVFSKAGGKTFRRARPAYNGPIDPTNATQMEEFSLQYGDYLFPQDTTHDVNMTKLFRQPFIKHMTKDVFLKFFVNQELLDDEFSEIVAFKVKEINSIMGSVHDSIEETCRRFVGTRDRLLPIRFFELFNNAYEENSQKTKELEEKKRTETQAELESKKLAVYAVTQPEPGFIESTKAELLSLGSLFSFSWGIKTPTEDDRALVTDSFMTTSELNKIYTDVKEEVEEEIEQLAPEFHEKAEEEVFQEAMQQFIQEKEMKTDSSNLEVYFSAICNIKKTYYVYDKETGILYIKNPARSRFHLTILAKNVIENYESIIKSGIKKIDERTGETIIDIPDDERLENLRSLYEKAQAILPILSTYDEQLTSYLAEGTAFADNVDEFFDIITNMWIDLKIPITKALLEFPITAEKEEIEKARIKEKFRIKLETTKLEGEQNLEQWMVELEQKNKENKLSEEELELWNKYIGLKVSGVVKPFEIAVTSLINTTGNVVGTGFEKGGEILDKGVSSITRTVYAIVTAGMSIIITLALGSAVLGCGPVGRLVSNLCPQKKPVAVAEEKPVATSTAAQQKATATIAEEKPVATATAIAAQEKPVATVAEEKSGPFSAYRGDSKRTGFAAFRGAPSFAPEPPRQPRFGESSFGQRGFVSRNFGTYREAIELSDEEDYTTNMSLTGSECNPECNPVSLRPPRFRRDISEQREIRRELEEMKLNGGARKYKRKTRKNKKRRTRKFKAGKRRYTRHRNGRPTKRR